MGSGRAAGAPPESEDTLRAVVAASPDIILVLGPDARIRSANPAVERVLGYRPDERVGQTPQDIVHPDDAAALAAGFRDLLDPGVGTMDLRYRLRHADGHWVTVEGHGRALASGGEVTGAVVVSRDISDRVLGEAALEAARRSAEAASLAKSEFLSRMSHELRTPLNSVLGFAQLLDMDARPDQDQANLRQIMRAGSHLLALVDDVLDLSRVEAGRMALSMEPVPACEILEECLDLVRPQAAARDVSLGLSGCASEYVRADRQRLKQVVLNLLSNAVKFNREGGDVAVTCAREPGGRVRVAVTDTGPGISPDDAATIFTPFSRIDADARGVDGTGLGLALSRRLVEAMGGTIGFEGAPGLGSTFHIELPAAPVDVTTAREPETEEAAVSTDPGSGGHRRVLYVEDNLANLRLLEQLFEKRPGVELVPAMQGSIGLDLAAQHHPDLILLDLHLPDMPGREVLAHLHADPATADIPVVVISADATPGQMARLREAGAHDYLTKPLNLRHFLEVLDNVLDSVPAEGT